MRTPSKVLLGLSVGLGWVGIGLAVSACSGDDNATFTIVQADGGGTTIIQLSDGGTAKVGQLLISSSATPADSACTNGGTTISVGYDTNGNGVLDPSEVTSTQEICNPAKTASTPQILTTLTAVGPDDQCANGGTIIQSGPDTNGNGKLDPSEVTSTQEICGGGTSSILSITTPLPVGSNICPLGGTQTQSGPDNGAGGGIAGDGILEPGEVTNTIDTCVQPANASSYAVQPFAPPAAVPDQPSSTISLNGGTSMTADAGGGGGTFVVEKAGTLGGHIKFFKTGLADAGFTVPAHTPSYGTGKLLDVTASNTPVVITTQTPATATQGQFYIDTSNNNTLEYFQDATSAANKAIVVTGIHVGAMTSLTLPANDGQIDVPNDIVVEGTVTSGYNGLNAEGFTLASDNGAFVSLPGSSFVASGLAGTAGLAGGNGGAINLSGQTLSNQGSIVTSGGVGGPAAASATNGAGENGGSAGSVSLAANGSLNTPLYNKGTITAKGGNATVTALGTGTTSNLGANGGSGGSVSLTANFGGLYNSGDISTEGGDGAGTSGGGSGNTILLRQSAGGDSLLNSGALTTSGGNVDTSCTGNSCGGAASAGTIQVNHAGGSFINSGTWTANGGAIGGTSGGASGGFLQVTSENGQNPISGQTIAYGNVVFSGSISANGGSPLAAGVGGPGGVFVITQDTPSTLSGQEIQFLGYTTLSAAGGNGGAAGGSGGNVQLNNAESNANGGGRRNTTLHSSGAIINYLDIIVSGGAGSATNATSTGGTGGTLNVQANDGTTSATDDDDAEVFINTGAITISGGNAALIGGTSGSLTVSTRDGLTNSGVITDTSGASSAVGGRGGYYDGAGNVLQTNGVFTNTAALHFDLGSATVPAGSAANATASGASYGGGELLFSGAKGFVNTAAITANGGSSVGVAGGNGIVVTLQSGGAYSNTGTISVAGGSGLTAGANGDVSLNGIIIQ